MEKSRRRSKICFNNSFRFVVACIIILHVLLQLVASFRYHGTFPPAESTSLCASKRPPPKSGEPERILLTSFIYGKAAAHKNYLRLFLLSARHTADVDFLLMGDFRPPFDLPPNVKHLLFSWDALIDRVQEKLFHGEEVGDLRKANIPLPFTKKKPPHKVNDFKPLFAYLFPEHVEGYNWWGHIDTDLVIGNIRKLVTEKVLRESDIITAQSGDKEKGTLYTHGPLTMYRNIPVINELFKLSLWPLKTTFGTRTALCFDEWGECGRDFPRNHVEASMSGIIHNFAENLGLRWRGNAFRAEFWDYPCFQQENRQELVEDCNLCTFRRGELISTKPTLNPDQPIEVAYCHYRHGKANLEKSLDDNSMEYFERVGEFQVSYDKGFRRIQS